MRFQSILFWSTALLCFAFSLSSGHAAEVRTWTSASDPSQTFEGALLDYNADTGLVTVNRGDRKLTFRQELLSAEDIAYLKAAPAIAAPAAPLRFTIANSFEIAKVPADVRVGFCLYTGPERQYVAYYDAERNMTVASRALDSTEWDYHTLDSKIGWDSHNYVTLAVDSAGHLHVSGNMHNDRLVYFRTTEPGDISTLEPAAMTGERENRVTYPRFFADHEGRLVFTYRHGGSGNGMNLYNRYDTETRRWARLLDSPLFDGAGKRNAYPNGPLRGPDGWFHVHWVWRSSPDCATNHHLSYARSPDLVNWESVFGEAVELPIRFDQRELVVDPIPIRGGIINGGHRMIFDANHKPVIAYHKNDEAGNMQIYAASPENRKWNIQPLTDWEEPVPFSGRGSMGFIGINLGTFETIAPGVLALSYRHKDYGSGTLQFDANNLNLVSNPQPIVPKYPSELQQTESDFPGIGIRRAEDSGTNDTPGVRYLLQWETLGPNRDRPRKPPLPDPSTLRLYQLTGAK